jgi:3-methyladenine DNA glycosylase AlkD
MSGASDTPRASRDLIEAIRKALHELAVPEKAVPMQAYMKSEMPYLGVQTPHHRKACKKLFRKYPLETFEAWRDTVLVLFRRAQYREERYCALNLINDNSYREFQDLPALPVIREIIVTGAWWDLVDNIAPYRLGDLLDRHPGKLAKTLRAWARSDDIWERRAAIISQLKRQQETDLDLLYDAIEPSLGEREFFLRKGIGWALREHAKTDPAEIERYVRSERARLSRLSQREALRNVLSAAELNLFLAGEG